MAVQLLELAGKEKKVRQKQSRNKAVQFDKLIAPHVKSAEENADYSKMYNPQSFDTFIKYTDKLDLKNLSRV